MSTIIIITPPPPPPPPGNPPKPPGDNNSVSRVRVIEVDTIRDATDAEILHAALSDLEPEPSE